MCFYQKNILLVYFKLLFLIFRQYKIIIITIKIGFACIQKITPYIKDMKKLLILTFLFSTSALAFPFGECPPYEAQYGDELIFDLTQKPILAQLKDDLKTSNLFGAMPSFSLFKTSTEPVYYPNGSVKVSFQTTGENAGIQNIFYENGSLMASIPYQNGQKNGIMKINYADGAQMALIPYVNDMINGNMTTYYPTGSINMKQSFVNSTAIGMGQMFHPNGSIALTQNYQNGLVNGLQTQYYNNGGNIQSEITYENGVMVQTARLYYENTALLAEITLQNGIPAENVCYTQNGAQSTLTAVELYKFMNGMRPIKCYFQTQD